jgi:hypothetical protein
MYLLLKKGNILDEMKLNLFNIFGLSAFVFEVIFLKNGLKFWPAFQVLQNWSNRNTFIKY